MNRGTLIFKFQIFLVLTALAYLTTSTFITVDLAAAVLEEDSPPPYGTFQGIPAPERETNYVPDQFIVKFKSTGPNAVTEDLEAKINQNLSLTASTADQSDSIEQLNNQVQVQKATLLFNPQGTLSGLSTSQTQEILQLHYQEVRDKFPNRTQRASSQETPPDLSQIYLMDVAPGQNINAICQLYQADPHVEYAQPNYLAKAMYTPNDRYFASSGSWGQSYDDLWGLKSDKMDMQPAWDLSQGQDILVAVVDSGVDYNHPDINDNIWTGSQDIPDNGIDDDANGYVDDFRGWNFAYNNNDPMDGHGHGTHVAGTIAAEGNNTIGIIGVAPQAKILPVKGLGDSGSGSITNLANAIIYAAEQGAAVINNSWGCTSACPSIPVVEDAVRLAHSYGAVVVFAAGNSFANVKLYSPQNMAETITVAATDHLDQLTSFSNYGALLDVSAPGGESAGSGDPNSILSLQAEGTELGPVVSPGYVRLRGTSMAAPHVAGLAALIIEKNPDFNNEDVRTILRASADDIGDLGFDAKTGYGRVNAQQALNITSPCIALTTNPLPDSLVQEDIVSIEGTASCQSFRQYYLDVGPGKSPSSWTRIKTSSTPVTGAPLGTWDATDAAEGYHTIRLTVENNSGNIFYAYSQVQVLKMVHDGWPKDFGWVEFPPNFGDFDQNGLNDITFSVWLTTVSGALDLSFAIDHTTQDLPGWPINWRDHLGTTWTPTEFFAVGDVDGDGELENVVTIRDGYVFVVNGDGSIADGWPQHFTPDYDGFRVEGVSFPMLLDVDQDGSDEIIVYYAVTKAWSENNWDIIFDAGINLIIYNGDGSPVEGWPKELLFVENQENKIFYHITSGDFDLDGKPEFVFNHVTDSGFVINLFDLAGNTLPGWPFSLPYRHVNFLFPNIGDLTGDGRPEIIFPFSEESPPEAENPYWPSKIYALQFDGTYAPGWPINLDEHFDISKGVAYSTILTDLTGDKLPEVITFMNGNNKLAAYSPDGSMLPGWPVDLAFTNPNSLRVPISADIDNDNHSDILVTGANKTYAIGANGNILPGWPKALPGLPFWSPSVSDVDGDGLLELLLGGSNSDPLYLYDLEGTANPRTMQWTNEKNDAKLTRNYVAFPSVIESIKTPNEVKHNWYDLRFTSHFTQTPLVFADMQTFSGGDTGSIRLKNIINSGLSLKVEEEQSQDQETGHTKETVGVLAVANGPIINRDDSIIGYAGMTFHRQPNRSQWTKINLPADLDNPIVLMRLQTVNGQAPVNVRLRNVTSNSFEFKMEEWNYDDGSHSPELLAYVAIEQGRHFLPDGHILLAQVTEVSQKWKTEYYASQTPFPPDPILFSQSQDPYGDPVVTRQRNITQNSFQIRLQEEQAADATHSAETVGYLVAAKADVIEAGKTPESMNHSWQRIVFNHEFKEKPLVIGAIETFNDGDPAHIRLKDVSRQGFTVKLEEEQSKDSELDHSNEIISYLAFEGVDSKDIFDIYGNKIGLIRKLDNLSLTNADDWSELASELDDPVFFAEIQTYNSPEPAHMRLDSENVTLPGSVAYKIEHWIYQNNTHPAEQVGFIFLEKGTHVLSDGKVMVVGELEMNQVNDNWLVYIQSDYFNTSPVVITQPQTFRGKHPIVTRQRSVAPHSFAVRLQEEENADGNHMKEKVGFIMIGN